MKIKFKEKFFFHSSFLIQLFGRDSLISQTRHQVRNLISRHLWLPHAEQTSLISGGRFIKKKLSEICIQAQVA
jgi:hypothetical protein